MIPEGTCIKCNAPLINLPGEHRPFCKQCEQKINEKIAKGQYAKGLPTKNMRIIFPKDKDLRKEAQ